jgi:hypothetical protein
MANPRWVGDVAEENVEREIDLAEMAKDQSRLATALDVFQMPGWEYLDSLISGQIEEAVRTLRTRAKSMEEVEHARGMLHALEMIHSLPRDIRTEYRRVTDILNAG